MIRVTTDADQDEHLEQAGEGIADEGTAESLTVARLSGAPSHRRRMRTATASSGNCRVGAAAREHADHQEHHLGDRQDDLRRASTMLKLCSAVVMGPVPIAARRRLGAFSDSVHVVCTSASTEAAVTSRTGAGRHRKG